jgi:hypothetical protein
MTARPELDAWLVEADALLERVMPVAQCDDDTPIIRRVNIGPNRKALLTKIGSGVMPTTSRGTGVATSPPTCYSKIAAPAPPPWTVEQQAGDGPTQPSPANILNAIKRIAMERAKKTARTFRKGDPI